MNLIGIIHSQSYRLTSKVPFTDIDYVSGAPSTSYVFGVGTRLGTATDLPLVYVHQIGHRRSEDLEFEVEYAYNGVRQIKGSTPTGFWRESQDRRFLW